MVVKTFLPTLYIIWLIGYQPEMSYCQTTNSQFWADYVIDIPFQMNLLEAEISYQTLLSNQGKWRSINVTPTYERTINSNIDLLFGLPISFTLQREEDNTFEIRTQVGMRLNLTPHNRIQTRFLLRHEYRFLEDIERHNWERSNRFRGRFEVIIPLNRSTYSADRLWYTLIDNEVFFIADNQVSERFANRARTRIGIGYRLSHRLRFEAIYTIQQSRDEIGDPIESVDHIIRFRLKHYPRLFLKHKIKYSNI